MSRVVHFELAADDPERAAGSWGEAFRWEREIPVVGWFVRCRDAAGSVFSVLEPPEAAS